MPPRRHKRLAFSVHFRLLQLSRPLLKIMRSFVRYVRNCEAFAKLPISLMNRHTLGT